MEEWQKILVTALASFFVGILSEPIRTAISSQIRAKQIRRSLYVELSDYMNHLRIYLGSRPNDGDYAVFQSALVNFPFNAHSNAIRNSEIYYALSDAKAFDRIVGTHELIVRKPIPFEDFRSLRGPNGHEFPVHIIQNNIYYLLRIGSLNEILLKEANFAEWEVFNRLRSSELI